MSGAQRNSAAQIRRSLRAARRQIPAPQRRAAAASAARALRQLRWLRPGTRIALYMATAEEFDCAPLLAAAAARGASILLPRLRPGRSAMAMQFVTAHGAMRRNRFGILEPRGGLACGARWLSLILLPLVAFDAAGTRLGMGAGYYDRALAFRLLRSRWRGPLLIGVAFALQQSPALPRQPHDVALDGVITERGLQLFSREGR